MPNDLERATVRLYRIYNMTVGDRGTPFALCDAHYRDWRDKGYPKGNDVIVEKIADASTVRCEECQ